VDLDRARAAFYALAHEQRKTLLQDHQTRRQALRPAETAVVTEELARLLLVERSVLALTATR
jgi:hypothetical protein